MKTTNPFHITVVGAGLAGLTAAALLARSGHRVTVLDRDPQEAPPGAEQAWEHWARPGVSQFRQPHLMLPSWHRQMNTEFPELPGMLLEAGAQQVNMLHLQEPSVVGGWQDGDEAFNTVTARRPVLEAALCKLLASGQQRLRIRRGVAVRDLLIRRDDGIPRVLGVRTDQGEIRSDLVIDAAGRNTRLPRWVSGVAPQSQLLEREPSGFIYYARHYRTPDGRPPQSCNPVLSHFPSLSVLTLPCDAGTYSLVLVASSQDHALRELRDEAQWLAAVAANPVAAREGRPGNADHRGDADRRDPGHPPRLCP